MNSHKRYLADKREALFPNLRKDAYEVTSCESGLYNCIAHAAGKNEPNGGRLVLERMASQNLRFFPSHLASIVPY